MDPLDTPSRRSRSKQRPRSSYNRNTTTIGPTVGAMPIQCQCCSGQAFRRSRLRSEDIWQMVLMRYPVRCLRCSQRQMVSFTIAGISISSITKHTRPIRPEDTWKHWTEPTGESGSHPTPRPNPNDE